MEKTQIAEKLDRIALYLTEQRKDIPMTIKNAQKWEDLQEAIGIVEAARKSL